MNIVKSFKKYFKDDIVRRVFVKNTFDGIITVLGILVALFFARIMDTNIIIASCLGSGIAIGVSGIWGAYATESAERKLHVKRIEKHLLKNLGGTRLDEWSKESSLVVALFDGISPLVAVIIMIIPFFFSGIINTKISYLISFSISVIIITFLGVMISEVSKEKVVPNILKMLLAGVFLTIILYGIELIKKFFV